MKIILKDNTELTPIIVTGGKRQLQGANRDCLHFVFDESIGLDEADGYFNAANCESIKIVGDDGSESVYKGYTVRAELKKADEIVQSENPESEAVTVKRITVSMAQRTYAESQLAVLAAESTDTQLAVAELAEIVMGGAA